jgi:preprotein translocase subunit Sss1
MGISKFGRDSRETMRMYGKPAKGRSVYGDGRGFDDQDRFVRTERTPIQRRRRQGNFTAVAFVGLVALVIVGIIGFNISQFTVASSATCTVVDKNFAQASDGNGNSHGVYRIATSNCGVLEVRDNLLRGKFNSADTYYAIKVGGTYRFEMTGYRIPIFSAFPGIVSATPVDGAAGPTGANQG